MTRRDLLAGAVATATANAATRKPNIVWFMYDDLGSAGLSCYGQQRYETPNSDRLAREGMRSTACYAGGAVCAPSRSVLMSGLHLGHAPVRANAATVPLEPGDLTVAEVLKKAGYATGHFGKWGLGDAGTTGAATRKGFDEFFGYLHQTHAHTYWPEYLRHNEQKVMLPGNNGGKRGEYSAELIQDATLKFVRKNAKQPFFLYASPTLPHGLFHPPDDAPFSGKPWTQSQKNYAAMVSRADRYLGQLLDTLRELKLENETVVFCTSDNGGPELANGDAEFFSTNGKLRDYKGTVYEGGIRTPMIIRWPGNMKPGSTSDAPRYFADFLPTACEIARVATPEGLDGASMLKAASRDRFLYWEQHGFNARERKLIPARMQQAARSGDWKAVWPTPGAPVEIYNLRADPSEAKNVAANNPKVARRFEEYFKTCRTEPRPHDNGSYEWQQGGIPAARQPRFRKIQPASNSSAAARRAMPCAGRSTTCRRCADFGNRPLSSAG